MKEKVKKKEVKGFVRGDDNKGVRRWCGRMVRNKVKVRDEKVR